MPPPILIALALAASPAQPAGDPPAGSASPPGGDAGTRGASRAGDGAGRGATRAALPPEARPHSGPPAPVRPVHRPVVPRAAAPEDGAPGPLAEAEEGTPLGVAAGWNLDPLAAFPEARVPSTPAQQRRMLVRRGRKRARDPNHRFLPLPHFSSQPATGLTLGGSMNYSYRRPGEVFNRAYGLAWSRVSVKGVQDHIISGRLRDMLGKREVFQFGVWISLDPVFPFYGVNNHDDLAGTDLEGPYHLIRMDNYGGWFTYEHPLWQLHRPNRAVGTLRLYSGLFYYVDVVRGYPNSQLVREFPEAQGVTRRGVIRGGLTWDSRENDWSPREGSLIDVTFDAAGPWTGSTQAFGRMHTSVRHYWSLGETDLVLAHRVTLDTLWGQAPLMAMGEFGGLFPIDAYGGAFIGRGFTRRRFIGNHKAALGLELRYMPVELKFGRHTLGVGWEGFLEAGFVSMRIADLLKHAYFSGGPGVLLIWDRFVVFRVEAGFSREGSAVYLQSEHAF